MPTRVEYATVQRQRLRQAPGPSHAPAACLLEEGGLAHRDLLDVEATGFRAHVYHNEATQEVVIAYSGTHIAESGDLSAGWAILNGRLPLAV